MVHPMYRNMHSYPYQRDQMHYSPHFYPGTEPTPAQMYMNPSNPPISYGYAPPMACYGCCNHHTYMPVHYPNWGSPYSHHIPPPPHCPVSYPSFPAQYMTCCPMGQPRHEFEKNVPTMRGQHYCGCPNHLPHPIEPGNVKIDEEEPGSVAPLQLKNEHSPIVWMPPDNNGNTKEQRKDNGEGNDNNQVVWKAGAKNGWYPLDLNNLVSMKKESGDKERKHQRGDDDESEGRHCPLPLFWIPYKPEEMEKEKEMGKHNLGNLNTKPSLDPPGEKKIQVKEESSNNRERESDVSVKDGIIDHGEKKLPKESAKRKNPSPPKSSKLPPVCLRVDPLPRRKAANGSLQSDVAKSKVTNSSDDKKVCNIVPTNEIKEDKGTKTIRVVDGKTLQENNMHVNVDACFDQPEVKPVKENSTRECIENDATKGFPSEEVSSMRKNEEGTKMTNKRKLSEEEAAVIIQSVYRGFDTRRWDPVKKLKEIAEVREQVDGVKHMIQAMESCSDNGGSSKQRNVISETIMRLLLKLDTIQGLHPSIREVRKSVVKELVSLQEKLDSIMIEKLGNSSQQESNLGSEEDASNKIEDATLSKNGNEALSDSSEADQNQPEGAFICENSEISDGSEVLIDKLEKEDGKSNEGLESDEISDPKNLMVEQSSEVPILLDPSIKEADQKQPEGAFICKNSEISEANEVLMDKLEKEDEKSNEGLESDEVSDNRENFMVEQSSEVPILPDSSIKEADQNQPGGAFISEKSEISEAGEVLMDKLEKEDGKSNGGLESDEVSDNCEDLMVEQSSEVPILPDSSSKFADFAPSDRDECGSELAALPQGDLDDIHAQEKKTIQEEEELVTLESQNDEIDDVLEADIKTCHGDKLEHEECIETKSDVGVGDANDSIISEKAIDNPPEKEVSGDQLLYEGNLQRDMAEETDTAIKEPENDTTEEDANGDEKISAREMNVESEKGVVDLTESNRKLIEENKKLRGIMENLIKSGQEQLIAISSLTGRVKDLERKLCKKKKLKVKQGKGRKMRGLVHE